ncbi:hypothetical protein [Streptomyces sp. NPDC058855]|uniref:hypothetical protein n=1 Tax=Streptomyces sp. NPDC058855 TaxID=3346651 RepID=UPI0036B65BB1
MSFAAVLPDTDTEFAPSITVSGEMSPDAATLADLANKSVERLHEVAESVVVALRREVGSIDAPVLAQRLVFSAVIDGIHRDLVQSQVYLSLPDVRDPHNRAAIQLVLTATAAQHHSVLGDFQEFVRTIRTGSEAGT